jgi:hypothetical protein
MVHTLQLQSPKQLRIHRHDHSRSAHGDRTDAHGQINSPPDEKASCDRNGDNVISSGPNQILDHLSVGSAR